MIRFTKEVDRMSLSSIRESMCDSQDRDSSNESQGSFEMFEGACTSAWGEFQGSWMHLVFDASSW